MAGEDFKWLILSPGDLTGFDALNAKIERAIGIKDASGNIVNAKTARYALPVVHPKSGNIGVKITARVMQHLTAQELSRLIDNDTFIASGYWGSPIPDVVVTTEKPSTWKYRAAIAAVAAAAALAAAHFLGAF